MTWEIDLNMTEMQNVSNISKWATKKQKQKQKQKHNINDPK